MPIEMPRGLPFAVDTWTPASSLKRHRFLTHAHRDHLAGITTAAPASSSSSIYASRLTILIALRIFPQLDRASFVELEVGAPPLRVPDPDVGDFTVTAFDANHCPGAVMFLFEGTFGTVLHTGDCRLTPGCLHALPHPSRRIDSVFLDCTFARCPLQFPTKEESIRQVINCIWRHPNAPVVYLACDMLGQEDVLVEVSRAFGSKVHVDRDKNPDCHHALSRVAPDVLSDDPASRFHVMAFPRLADRATEVLALARARRQPEPLIVRPSSQWYAHYEASLHRRPLLTEPVRDEFGVWHVCLSMHSSREELEHALGTLRPRWVVSTTPPCMAMDLSYVRKHCSLSRLGPDDPLWKLLGITAIGKSETAATCSDGTTQVEEVAAEPTLQGFEVRAEPPPVTLFGSARFGLLQSESQLWEDEYQSVDVMDDSAIEKPGFLKKDSMPDNSSTEVIEITGVAADEHSPATEAESQTHGKSDGQAEVIDSTEDERLLLLQSYSARSELCKDDKRVELVKGNREAEPKDQKHEFSVRSDSSTICRSRATEQGKIRTKMVEEISAVHITVSSKNNKDVAEDRATPLEAGKKLDQDSEPASDASTAAGSPKHLNANLRRLYRSMHVPVPRPLPSLVELMAAASKRPRVSQPVADC